MVFSISKSLLTFGIGFFAIIIILLKKQKQKILEELLAIFNVTNSMITDKINAARAVKGTGEDNEHGVEFFKSIGLDLDDAEETVEKLAIEVTANPDYNTLITSIVASKKILSELNEAAATDRKRRRDFDARTRFNERMNNMYKERKISYI